MKKTVRYKSSLQYKYIFIIFILIAHFQLLHAQKQWRYKDVYEYVSKPSNSTEDVYTILLAYHSEDTTFVNATFQLALAAQSIAKQKSMAADRDEALKFIDYSTYYFGIVKSNINDKDIRKNAKYYQNVDKLRNIDKLHTNNVLAYINEQLKVNLDFKQNVISLNNLLSGSIRNYHRCVNTYKVINRKYNSEKDIYLGANTSLNTQLNDLKISFDSCLYFFQNYQLAIKNFTNKQFNPKYTLVPIKTYRLDGLSYSNFMKDTVNVWDYKSWATNTINKLNKDAKTILKEIETTDSLINIDEQILKHKNTVNQIFAKYKLKPEFMQKLNRIDNNSLAYLLLNYRYSKIKFLEDLQNPIHHNNTMHLFTKGQKAQYYANLIYDKLISDSLNTELYENIDYYKIAKYGSFFTNRYGGESGLKQYSKNESIYLNKTIKHALAKYLQYIIDNSWMSKTTDSVFYNDTQLYLTHNRNWNNTQLFDYKVVDYVISEGYNTYIIGYLKNKSNKKQAFIAKSKNKKVEWLKIIKNRTYNTIATHLLVDNNVCRVLVHNYNNTNENNEIIEFDNEGTQKTSIKLNIKDYPRFFYYDNLTLEYIVAFKGNKLNFQECMNSDLTVVNINAITKKNNWITNLNIKGQLVSISKMKQKYYVCCNFTEYKPVNKKVIQFESKNQDRTNVLIVPIDKSGKALKCKILQNQEAYFALDAIKLLNNKLNIILLKGNIDNPIVKNSKFNYIIADENTDIIYRYQN